jgi:hypothetical protein
LWRQGLFSDEKMKQTLQTNVRFWGFESSEVEVRFEIYFKALQKKICLQLENIPLWLLSILQSLCATWET